MACGWGRGFASHQLSQRMGAHFVRPHTHQVQEKGAYYHSNSCSGKPFPLKGEGLGGGDGRLFHRFPPHPGPPPRGGRESLFRDLLSRISQMTSHTLAHELRQTFKNKVFDAFDAKVTGEPDG